VHETYFSVRSEAKRDNANMGDKEVKYTKMDLFILDIVVRTIFL
jgi:hypothetical protein